MLIADTPRGIDLERVGNLVRRLLGGDTPLVVVHYPRRKPDLSEVAAGRAFKPINTVQLWQAMADAVAPGRAVGKAASASASARPGTQAAGRLLVAEDDDINAKLIDNLLRKAGCDVALARDGRAALRLAAEQTFDLAFIDLRMPHMDGLDFTRAYRAQEPPGQHLPIVALTANAAEEVRAECLRAGMDEFVTKPVDPDILQELILRYGLSCRPA